MSRSFLLCLAVLAAIGIPGIWWWFKNEKAQSAPPVTAKDIYVFQIKQGLVPPPDQSAPTAIPWKETIRLAIGGLGYPDEAQNQQLGDLITVQLSASKGLELVERQELATVLREQELNLSGLVRASEAVRVGKLLHADWFLLGTISRINGTNSLVVRLVDTRTGVLCDGTVLIQKSMPTLARELADFVRQARRDAAEARPRVYLAIGTFQDLSVNNRQVGFATQLRGYLTAAYQHSRFTLLEREYAQILYQEMELDLAGLTRDSTTNTPVPIQSAFWLVDGSYQSYETTNFEVEVTLDVTRIFSLPKEVTLRGLSGEPVCREIKQAIDGILNKPAGLVIPSRISEVRAQMSAGKRLSGLKESEEDEFDNKWKAAYAMNSQMLDEQNVAMVHHNFEEAVRAFDAVLLLEPTNREAKFYLAACYRNWTINRMDEARNLYREILEQPVQDDLSTWAEKALVDSFRYSSPREEAQWFEKALPGVTNSALEQFYHQNAETAERDAALRSGQGDITKLAEQRLLETIQSTKNNLKEQIDGSDFGLRDFSRVFPDKAAAAQKMIEFLPTMKSRFPELTPHLTAAALTFQTDTNSPVVAEFQKQLEWCQAHPKEVYMPEQFWSYSGREVSKWLFNHKLYLLALQTMEGWQSAANQKITADDSFADEKRIALGYAYMNVGRWQAAMEVFDSFSNKPVALNGEWPWGNSSSPVLTSVQANYCREKLGLPVVRDPREFKMDKAAIQLCSCSTFVVDGNGLWVGINDRLIHLDFNLETNLEVTLPKDYDTWVTAICEGPSNLWIGTAGDGLIKFDKTTHKCWRFTVQDGLMMNDIASLEIAGDSLWIGYGGIGTRYGGSYGGANPGGLGRMDLISGKLSSFMASLNANTVASSSEAPPQIGVRKIVCRPDGDLWMSEGGVIRQFQVAHGIWKTLPGGDFSWMTCFCADSEYLVEGGAIHLIEAVIGDAPGSNTSTENYHKTNMVLTRPELRRLKENLQTNRNLGFIWSITDGRLRPKGTLSIQNLHNHRWQHLEDAGGLPNPPGILALDGNDLWVGSEGYITLVDLKENKVKKFCYIRARDVDRIQIGGGYLWAQYNGYLHRAALRSIK